MISFIIRTKNEAAKIDEVLNRICSQKTEEEIEIIIVDSGSEDLTLSIAQKYNCRIVQIPPESFTWGYALNVGIKNAKGNIIGIVSGHCILIDNYCVDRVCSVFREHDDISVVYGCQRGDLQDDPFEKYNNDIYYPNVGGVHYLNQETSYTTTISNACCFLRKQVWEKIKYDEVVQSCEDAKWAEAVTNEGYKLAYWGDIGVYHSHKLDCVYIYKKSFWREFEMKTLRHENKTKIFYFLKFLMKHFLLDYLSWRRRLPTEVGSSRISAFCYITNLACYKASVQSGFENKYEAISVPRSVGKVGEKL